MTKASLTPLRFSGLQACLATVACLAGFAFGTALSAEDPTAATFDQDKVTRLVSDLIEASNRLDSVPFAKVVQGSTGHHILPFNPESAADQRILAAIITGVENVLAAIEAPDNPIHQIGRINEVSNAFEDILVAAIDAVPGIFCGMPLTARGTIQASGYPDMLVLDEETGRVFYLDPKVHREGSERSSFRTFYFEPRIETNKINHDATHLILGLSHRGKIDGRWTFAGWNLVDLTTFEVRLKAEFQASNRDLYRAEAIIFATGEAD